MQPAKLDILVAFFSYAGNGGFASQLPQIRSWWAPAFHKLASDPRIGTIAQVDLTDTPITMSRNRALHMACETKMDVVIMVDSDNEPDLYVGKDATAKPFMDSSLDFAYRRLMQGLPTIIGAPYCGPPPHPTGGGEENCYVFKWKNHESNAADGTGGMEVIAYDRTEAALMSGIAPAAALPTGLILITTKALECLDPPYFRYEWKDRWEDQKASTEDVYFTRNIAMAGYARWKAPIVFANWDAWAGHHKPKCVGKPLTLKIEQVCEAFTQAVNNGFSAQERLVYVNPEIGADEQQRLRETEQPTQVKQFTERRDGRDFIHLGFRSNVVDRTYLQAVVQMLPKDRKLRGVEIGSWVGDSATAICDEAPYMYLTCVDTFNGSETDGSGELAKAAKLQSDNGDIVLDTFKRNTEYLGFRVKSLRLRSCDAAKLIEDGSLDFCYIDAGHSYEEVSKDIAAWLPKMQPDGIIAGHDMDDHAFPGVAVAVREAFGDNAQVMGHVWYVKMADIAEVDDPEPQSTQLHRDPPLKAELVPEAEVDAEDIDNLREVLDVWNPDNSPRRIVYVGDQNYATLDALAESCHGGPLFVVCSAVTLDQQEIAVLHRKNVKFIVADDMTSANFWEQDRADMVFVHYSACKAELLERAVMLIADDGIIIGNGPDRTSRERVVFEANMQAGLLDNGAYVHEYCDGTLWAVFTGAMDASQDGNGKANHPNATQVT